MFDRFTEDARKALFFARCVASVRHGEQIELEDMLRGVMLAAPSAVVRFASDESALPPHTETGEDWFARILQGAPEHGAVKRRIPLSNRLTLMFERMVVEADALGQHAIRPEHLVLGLLREEGTEAWKILHRAGVSLREVRRVMSAEPDWPVGG